MPDTGRVLSGGFGVTEFQLLLLRRMADYQPALVEDARDRLGSGRDEMRAANAHWQRLLHAGGFPGGLRRYRLVLGAPALEGHRRVGDLRCTLAQWQLPLWPDLRFEVLAAGSNGPELHTWLVRAPGEPPPLLKTIADLAPWSCVVGDVERALAPVRHGEGDAPSRWTTEFTAPEEGGRPVRATGTFVYGLLQSVERRGSG